MRPLPTKATPLCTSPHRSNSTTIFFFFNDPATTEIYTLSLHDALPISTARGNAENSTGDPRPAPTNCWPDRKSTRLNSSHPSISYAVFCLKKKKDDSHRYHLSPYTNNGSFTVYRHGLCRTGASSLSNMS